MSGPVDCNCGEWSGERCAWTGPREQTVLVEFMPEFLRESHEAARNRGVWPHNGAVQIRVEKSCAKHMIKHDGEWCQIVEGDER